MKTLNQNKEWDFIKEEIHSNNYRLNSQDRRELLFAMQIMLTHLSTLRSVSKKLFLEKIYLRAKVFYLSHIL